MKIRYGKFGPFLGCSRYPDCKGIVNIPKKDDIPAKDMPTCPAKGCDGKLAQRRSRFGKAFFSCSNFPDCNVIVNDLDDIETKYPDHPKTAYVRKEKKGRWGKKKEEPAKKKAEGKSKGKASRKSKGKAEGETPGKAKEKAPKAKRVQASYALSPELSAVVEETNLSRPEATKKMWDYIKKHNLQDPKNKRLIVPDAKLAKVFGSKKPVDMLKLAGILSPHLKRP
jgi:DNA topoisomerase-1